MITLNILYPTYDASSKNYDFVRTGIASGIQFIGLNFQMNDVYLKAYNTKYFKSLSD